MTDMSNRRTPFPNAALIGRSFSLIGGGAVARLLWAGGLAALLWVAAAWAMGWLS